MSLMSDVIHQVNCPPTYINFRPVTRIFRMGVTWMFDLYVCMHKHERLVGSGGMLPQEI